MVSLSIFVHSPANARRTTTWNDAVLPVTVAHLPAEGDSCARLPGDLPRSPKLGGEILHFMHTVDLETLSAERLVLPPRRVRLTEKMTARRSAASATFTLP